MSKSETLMNPSQIARAILELNDQELRSLIEIMAETTKTVEQPGTEIFDALIYRFRQLETMAESLLEGVLTDQGSQKTKQGTEKADRGAISSVIKRFLG